MRTEKPNFANLEKKMAKDNLKQALKVLHDEIIKDIQKENKNDFSAEIKKQ